MGAGMDDEGKFLGDLEATGLRPHFGDRLADEGIALPADLFRSGAVAGMVPDDGADVVNQWRRMGALRS